jgi:hypothetical protein
MDSGLFALFGEGLDLRNSYLSAVIPALNGGQVWSVMGTTDNHHVMFAKPPGVFVGHS